MKRLNERSVWISGGSDGMGKATAILAAKEGAKVMVFSRNEAKCRAVCDEIRFFGGTAAYTLGSIGDENAVKASIDATVSEFGSIDMLVNNAGITASYKFAEIPTDVFKNIYETNVYGPYYAMKHAIPYMEKQQKFGENKGIIVNVASISALHTTKSCAAYSSSKAAVVMYTKAAAVEYAPEGIRINCVCPGFTKTSMVEKLKDDMVEVNGRMVPYVEWCESIIPARRAGNPDDVAKAIVWLLSEESSYIYGAVIPVDGAKVLG